MGTGFESFIIFGILSAMLLAGTLLRAKVKFFQSFLVPSGIIGGLLGFLIISTGWVSVGGEVIGHKAFNFFVFHAFNISYMSLLLTRSRQKTGMISTSREIVRGGMWQTLIWSISLGGQALIGGGVIWLYNAVTGGSVNELLGMIATHGYTQGPGQAFAMGSVWEANGVTDAVSVGLIFAALGFVTAAVIGVPVARWFIGKGLNANKDASLHPEFISGIMDEDNFVPNGRETTHSSTIDTLSFHLAILGVCYLITFVELSWVQANIKPLFEANKWTKGLASMCSMPMFFIHGLVVAYCMRKVLEKLGAAKLMDPVVQTRITGASVDYLITATLMAIEFHVLAQYVAPIALVAVTVTVFTLFVCLWFGRRIAPYGPERVLCQFGCCCGSTATGLLLLRIVDPDYSTPGALELGFFNVAILFTTAPILYFLAPMAYALSGTEIILAYGGYTLLVIGAMFALRLVGKKVW